MRPIEKPKRLWQVKAAKQRQRGSETGSEANPRHSHDAGVRPRLSCPMSGKAAQVADAGARARRHALTKICARARTNTTHTAGDHFSQIVFYATYSS